MPTTNGNRKLLDLKRWESVAPLPTATAAGRFICSSRHHRQRQLYVVSNTEAWMYIPEEDGWVAVPSPGLAGTFGAGAAGVASCTGPSGTATGGTTTTINTGLNIQRDLRGYHVHITAGPNAGVTAEIASNTIGANSIITVTSAFGTAITSSSVFRLLTPRYFILGAGALAAGIFRVYDFALNTWTTLAQTNLPATIGTDSKLVSTPSYIGAEYVSFATGTATAGGTTTLTLGTANWTTNQWANAQVRIVSGTGAGQIRTIASNTATVLTVSAAWATNPDATSVFSIEGNDDFIYYLGSAAVGIVRYSITANTWTVLTPGVARGAAPGAGMSAHWVWDVNDPAWTNVNAIQNGRYIYSFRGGASAVLDRYDIALNTWNNAIAYAPNAETVTTGTKYVYSRNWLYFQRDATGRWLRFNFATSELDGWSFMPYTQGAAVVGDTAFDATYIDGSTEIDYIYMGLNTSNVVLRMMVV